MTECPYTLFFREMVALQPPHVDKLCPSEYDDEFSESVDEEEYMKALGKWFLFCILNFCYFNLMLFLLKEVIAIQCSHIIIYIFLYFT